MIRGPCPDCGSSDARAEYATAYHCFSCNKHTYKNEEEEDKCSSKAREEKDLEVKEHSKKNKQEITGIWPEMTDRGISKATAEKYKVFVPEDTFYKYGYPMFRNGEHIANKFRLSGDKKGFSVDGEFNKSELFGQWAFPPGSAKAITVTEGCDDAMAAYELQGSRYPSVSVHSASTARKDCADNYEYLNSFPEIVLCFDKDEAKITSDGTKRYPGQEASGGVCQTFPGEESSGCHASKAQGC